MNRSEPRGFDLNKSNKHTIESDIWIGDEVYHKADGEKRMGIVTHVHITSNGLSYTVQWTAIMSNSHFRPELTTEFEPRYNE